MQSELLTTQIPEPSKHWSECPLQLQGTHFPRNRPMVSL